jgi:hypothetical protein
VRLWPSVTAAALPLVAALVAVPADATELRADGAQDTYGLINGALAPRGVAIETPDCAHPEFGPHITQAPDLVLGRPVFRFHIHLDRDDDRCLKSDRQRNEIKVYGKSPKRLKAKAGETFVYRWKFRLDRSFRPSRRFTHLHQIKAVGGPEADTPLLTLSARKGRAGEPDRFELNYAERMKQRTVRWVPLQPLLGRWLEATERIAYGENGTYSLRVAAVDGGETLFSYESSPLRMWKSNADFLRPKWGIYRSLQDRGNLRDEIVDFTDFSIASE